MSEEKVFKTDNLGLFAYLDLHGLKYLGSEIVNKNGRDVVVLKFEDPLSQGEDLRRSFIRSRENEYRRLIHHYRRIVEEALNNYRKGCSDVNN